MILWVTIAVGAAVWAGLLALAEDSPAVSRTLGDNSAADDGTAAYRAVYVARLALLATAGVGAGIAMQWWTRPAGSALGATAVAAGFLYLVAEALPRSVAALAPDVAAAAVRAAVRSVGPFEPLASLADLVERGTSRWLPRRDAAHQDDSSVQRDLLLGIFSLGETTVSDVMTPRLDMDAVESTLDWPAIIDRVRRSEHARLPVYGDTIDQIEGILYAKDLVAVETGNVPRPDRWQDLIRSSQFVPESKPLAAQLHDFQRGPAHLAIVVDEYGGTSGLVTLEDVLEEVVGEIHDEYDLEEQPAVEREGEDKFWVDGAVTVDELEALLGIAIDREDINTVGGLVYDELGHVPVPGEQFQFGAYRVIVEQVIRRRVRRVYFERASGLEPSGNGRSDA